VSEIETRREVGREVTSTYCEGRVEKDEEKYAAIRYKI
jgi:hypothetical protein